MQELNRSLFSKIILAKSDDKADHMDQSNRYKKTKQIKTLVDLHLARKQAWKKDQDWY